MLSKKNSPILPYFYNIIQNLSIHSVSFMLSSQNKKRVFFKHIFFLLLSLFALTMTELSAGALHDFARTGDKENFIKTLKLGAKVNEKDTDGNTPLHIAVYYDNLEIVDLLLHMSASMGYLDKEGYSPLHLSIKKEHLEISFLLLERGASPNTKNNESQTPLHTAVLQNNIELVKKLLTHGAFIKIKDKTLHTALDYAQLQKNTEIIDILLGAGASKKYEKL